MMTIGLMVTAPTHSFAAPECKCRLFGEFFMVGEKTCLKTNKGFRIATCSLMLNNTSWKISRQSCMPGV